MKITIHTGKDLVDVPNMGVLRIPIVGEQVKVMIDGKPYRFDVSNVVWDYIEDEVIIEVT